MFEKSVLKTPPPNLSPTRKPRRKGGRGVRFDKDHELILYTKVQKLRPFREALGEGKGVRAIFRTHSTRFDFRPRGLYNL